MDITVGNHWESFVDSAVKTGRYGSASEVVRAALRLLEDRDEKIKALRQMLNTSIEEGGSHTGAEVMAHLKSIADRPLGLS
jgi:antitoxin ParD1/3/4